MGSELFNRWFAAEQRSYEILLRVKDDDTHPEFVQAAQKAEKLLNEFLNSPAISLHCVLSKLKVASMFEGFEQDVAEPGNKFVAPIAVVSAMRDLEILLRPALNKREVSQRPHETSSEIRVVEPALYLIPRE